MKPIRHLIAIVFLLCGLTAWGSDRGYDYDDMVGTYKYNETQEYVLDLHLHTDKTFMVSSTACDASCKHFGNWEVKGDLLILHFDKQGTGSLHVNSELDQYVMKELEILDKDNLFWGHHLQEGYEKRIELQRSDGEGSSSKRKTSRGLLKSLIEAPFDVIVNIYHYAPPPDLPYGDYSFYGVKYDQDAGRYVPKYSGSWITIYVQRAKERSEELGISLSEAIAVNFGHEIEHTTSENLELAYQNALKKEREYIPKQISKDMITEFVYLMTLKSLKDIQILPDPLIQTKLNIDIKVKE